MDRIRFALLLAAVCTAALARTGEAQQIPSPYRYIETAQEAGAFAGVLSPSTGRFDFGPRPGALLGLRYGIEISGPFSIEGVARTLSTTRRVKDPRREEGDRTIGEADVLLTAVEGRLKFSLPGRRTWHGLGPYLLVGGGLVGNLAGSAEVEEVLRAEDRFDFGLSFLGFLGLGTRWLPTDRLQLRLDGGFNLWQLDTPRGYRDPDRDLGFEAPPPENEWVSGLEATLGIAYRW